MPKKEYLKIGLWWEKCTRSPTCYHITQKIISWECSIFILKMSSSITMTIIVHNDDFLYHFTLSYSYAQSKKFKALGENESRKGVIIKQTSSCRMFLSIFILIQKKLWETRIKIEKTLRIEFSLSSLTVGIAQLHVE